MRQVNYQQQIQGLQIQVQNFSPSLSQGHKLGRRANKGPEELEGQQEKTEVYGGQNVFFDFDETLTRHDQGQALLDVVLKELGVEIKYNETLKDEKNPVKEEGKIRQAIEKSDFFLKYKEESREQVKELVQQGLALKKLYDVYYTNENPKLEERKSQYPWQQNYNDSYRTQFYSQVCQDFQSHLFMQQMKGGQQKQRFLDTIFSPKETQTDNADPTRSAECDTQKDYIDMLLKFFQDLEKKGQTLHILTLNIGEVQRFIIEEIGQSQYFKKPNGDLRILGYCEMDQEQKYLTSQDMSGTKMDFMIKTVQETKGNQLSILVEDSGSQRNTFGEYFSMPKQLLSSSNHQYCFELIDKKPEKTSGGLLKRNRESILASIDRFQIIGWEIPIQREIVQDFLKKWQQSKK